MEELKKIYCISGLGADEKAFARIRLPGYQLVVLPWLMPQKNETMEQYAKRMAAEVDTENPILMGLSFGGMMAIEMDKWLAAKKIVLISSIGNRYEMPRWMRWAGSCKLHQLVPLKPYPILEPLFNYRLGVTNSKEKAMVKQYRQNTAPAYLKWAVDKILCWQQTHKPAHAVHIHGDADKIFPVKLTQANFCVPGAGHFMIMNRAKEVNEILAQILP
jgi:pimeloyl-ACP methyl ester carboxylesterase